MLVLNRKIGERIQIGPGIEIAIVDVRGSRVRIGIEAPIDIRICRIEPIAPTAPGIDRNALTASAAPH